MAIKWNDLSTMEQMALTGLFPITLEFVGEGYKDLEKKGLVEIVRIDHRYCQVSITDAGRAVWEQYRAGTEAVEAAPESDSDETDMRFDAPPLATYPAQIAIGDSVEEGQPSSLVFADEAATADIPPRVKWNDLSEAEQDRLRFLNVCPQSIILPFEQAALAAKGLLVADGIHSVLTDAGRELVAATSDKDIYDTITDSGEKQRVVWLFDGSGQALFVRDDVVEKKQMEIERLRASNEELRAAADEAQAARLAAVATLAEVRRDLQAIAHEATGDHSAAGVAGIALAKIDAALESARS